MKKVGIIVGSLRKQSYNKAVAKYISGKLESKYEINTIDISKLEMYNEDIDFDNNIPTSWLEFRNSVKDMDAFIFFTPEYNRSYSACIKNALDVASRPYNDSGWDNKPAAIISVSMGRFGGFGASNHLRQTLTFLNLHVMPQPEAYIGEITQFLDEQGSVVNHKEIFDDLANNIDLWFNRF